MVLQPLHLVGVSQAAHELGGHLTGQQQAVAQLLVAQRDGPGQGLHRPPAPPQLALQLLLQPVELVHQTGYHSNCPGALAVPAGQTESSFSCSMATSAAVCGAGRPGGRPF